MNRNLNVWLKLKFKFDIIVEVTFKLLKMFPIQRLITKSIYKSITNKLLQSDHLHFGPYYISYSINLFLHWKMQRWFGKLDYVDFYRWREVSTSHVSKLPGSLVSVECNEWLSMPWKSSCLLSRRWRGCWTGTCDDGNCLSWGKENLGSWWQVSIEVIIHLGSDESFTASLSSLFSLNLSNCLNLSCRSAIDEPAKLGSLCWLPMEKVISRK